MSDLELRQGFPEQVIRASDKDYGSPEILHLLLKVNLSTSVLNTNLFLLLFSILTSTFAYLQSLLGSLDKQHHDKQL